jgi:hypothetical protein
MREIVQIEHRESLLSTRKEILRVLGYPVVSILGFDAAKGFDFGGHEVGVVVIGHRAPWHERRELVSHFRRTLPSVSIVALLGRHDEPFTGAHYSIPADSPPKWLRTIVQAMNRDLHAVTFSGNC